MPPLTESRAPWRVTSCEVIGDHRLHVLFRDGSEGDVQFTPSAFRGVFAHLIDPARFAEAEVVFGAVTWPGELDIAPDRIHADIRRHGVCVLWTHWVSRTRRAAITIKAMEINSKAEVL